MSALEHFNCILWQMVHYDPWLSNSFYQKKKLVWEKYRRKWIPETRVICRQHCRQVVHRAHIRESIWTCKRQIWHMLYIFEMPQHSNEKFEDLFGFDEFNLAHQKITSNNWPNKSHMCANPYLTMIWHFTEIHTWRSAINLNYKPHFIIHNLCHPMFKKIQNYSKNTLVSRFMKSTKKCGVF